MEGADCVGVQQRHRLWNRFRQGSRWPDRDKFQLLGAHAQRSPQEYHVQSVRRLDQHADFRWIGKVHSYVYMCTHVFRFLGFCFCSHASIILPVNLKFLVSYRAILHTIFKPCNLASFWAVFRVLTWSGWRGR